MGERPLAAGPHGVARGRGGIIFEPSGLGESRGQAEMFYDAAGAACHGPWTF